MALTETMLKTAVPKDKAYKLMDNDGLYAEVRPTGRIYFRVRYWYHGQERRETLGEFPAVKLREAKEKTAEIRYKLSRGEDPRGDADDASLPHSPTFGDIAAEWLKKTQAESTSVKYRDVLEYRLRKHVLGSIGDIPIEDISPRIILDGVIRPIEAQGMNETAHRVLSVIGRVFRFAVASDRASRDPTRDLLGALTAAKPQHFPSITDRHKWGILLDAIHGYPGYIVRQALKMLYLTFLRPGELRHAEWTEFNVDDAVWKIPARKMKMKRSDHIVPLSRQALEVLQELRPISGGGRYVFPGARAVNGDRALSDAALGVALKQMAFSSTEIVPHGFRHSASTFLNESRLWSADAIERQLSHMDADKIRATYNRAEYLDERTRMMQWWADWCDETRSMI